MGAWGAFLFRLLVALWVGGISIFTFLLTPALFRRYGKDQAGEIVGRLIGRYFLYNLALSIAAAVLFLLWWGGLAGVSRWLCLVLLLVAVLANLYARFLLLPRMEKEKKEIPSFEADPDAPARKRFQVLHRTSVAINALLLADGVLLIALEPLLRR